MARVGLSQSFYAKYSYSNGAVTYSSGGTLGKAVECKIELSDTDPTIFYANNGPAESAAAFSGGTLTITNDSLPLSQVADILGLTTAATTSPAGTTLAFPADLTVPYVGYGTVAKMIVGNSTVWRGIVLYKVQFQIPTEEFTTQGENIEFEGHELTATILRNDLSPAEWKVVGDYTTEANAVAWVKSILGIT